jgi:phospho-N-acetylmuramoyl-pentapeptide-transferase
MLYWLLLQLQPQLSFLNVFRYITFRSGMGALTSFLVVILLGRPFIEWVKRKQYGQSVRSDGPQSHLKKQGTPTMGGLLIVLGLSIGTLLWGDLSNPYIWLVLFITWAYAGIGLIDDWKKVTKRNSKGLSSRWKLRLQVVFALIVSWGIYVVQKDTPLDGVLYFPFLKNFTLNFGAWYLAFAVFVIVGTSNAVNLTDGLDGLAIGPSIVCGGVFFLLAYLGGNILYAEYLQIPHVAGSGELGVFCASLVASGVAFLWFNTYPAQIFMGDVGSLALGGALGALGVATKNEILLAVAGGVFVLETVSVIAQVISFKLTGRRIFKMAPIHHHFELLGWPEPKVIVRFWIVSFILGILALSTLKLR